MVGMFFKIQQLPLWCGVSLSWSLELASQCARIRRIGPATQADLHSIVGFGLGALRGVVDELHSWVRACVHSSGYCSSQGMPRSGVGGLDYWRSFGTLLQVAASSCGTSCPIFSVSPLQECPVSWLIPAKTDEEVRKAWPPFFVGSGRGDADLEDFSKEVDEWLPVIAEVQVLLLGGDRLAGVEW